MNLVSVNNINQSMGGRLLFQNVTFGIDTDSRIAVTGRNGCGKSTLLSLISGARIPESGQVSRNRELKIAVLEQSPEFKAGDSIADFVLSGDSREMSLIREYETLISQVDYDSTSLTLSNIMSDMEQLDCWNIENRIHSILTELGITELNKKMAELSGGMLKKVALARTLVVDSNMMILDEPTNHLDIVSINWLEKYLINSGKAIVLVTHDRYFMDAVCSRIIEIEDNTIFSYDGNYSRFLELKSMRNNITEKSEDRINNILRNEAEWIKRGPRARAGKDKKRKERFFELQQKVPQKKSESDSFSVAGRRLGGKILDIQNVSKSWDGTEFISNFSYSFTKGDRVGLLGGNGSGKSTLLNIITGRVQPDAGSVDIGLNTRIGYYDQLSKELPGDIKAIDYIKETAEIIELNDGGKLSPAQFLERFLFPRNMLYTEIDKLSGGEKKKLYLLKILLSNPNFLVFDEPTNDFDIQTLSILEDFLLNFSGCTLVVSHDRFFLDRITDFLFVLDGKGDVSGYSGDVTGYYDDLNNSPSEVVETSTPAASGKKTVKREKKGLTFNEKQEFEGIEAEIIKLEDDKAELDVKFSLPEGSTAGSGDLKKRYDELTKLIEEKYNRWEILEAKR